MLLAQQSSRQRIHQESLRAGAKPNASSSLKSRPYETNMNRTNWRAVVEAVGSDDLRFVLLEHRKDKLLTDIVAGVVRHFDAAAVDNDGGLILGSGRFVARLDNDAGWEWWERRGASPRRLAG